MTTTLATRHEPAGILTGRTLISPALFDKLVRRIVVDDHLEKELAERIVDQALAFLAACARNTSAPLAPSELVDLGWHAFLLHTRDYATFCHTLAGRFLHHVPNDPASAQDSSPESAPKTIRHTVVAIEHAGFAVDFDLWPHANAVSCTGCHNGCHDDPPPASR